MEQELVDAIQAKKRAIHTFGGKPTPHLGEVRPLPSYDGCACSHAFPEQKSVSEGSSCSPRLRTGLETTTVVYGPRRPSLSASTSRSGCKLPQIAYWSYLRTFLARPFFPGCSPLRPCEPARRNVEPPMVRLAPQPPCAHPHPVRSFTHKRSPTGMRAAFWDGLAPVPAPFILNGTHQDYTDCSTHRLN